jgi:hypothetical protein
MIYEEQKLITSGQCYERCTFPKGVLAEINMKPAKFYKCRFRATVEGDFTGSEFIECKFLSAKLEGCFIDCDFTGSEFSHVDLHQSTMSGAKGLLSQADFMSQFRTDGYGVVVYKSFGDMYTPPNEWNIKSGSVIEEVVNPDRTQSCGNGINFATAEWVLKNTASRPVWKCRIEWKDLAGVVVPYGSDGKARCERLTLVSKLSDNRFFDLVRKEREKK